MADSEPDLSRSERNSLALARWINQPGGKRAQYAYHRQVGRRWMKLVIGRRTLCDGIEVLARAPSTERGVVMALNHRTYFDAFVTMFTLYEAGADWAERIYFPVRSNFFYEHPLGLAVNVVLGGGTLYPPIFRDASKAALNKLALAEMAEVLARPGTLVGLHPEGTRKQDDDPYELLPAQPGVGQIVLQAHPVVVPVFITGLGNSAAADIRLTFQPNIRRDNPVIIVFGQPIDYGDLASQKPRAALYKRMADRMREAIMALGPRERELRARCARGEIADDHPGWALNLRR